MFLFLEHTDWSEHRAARSAMRLSKGITIEKDGRATIVIRHSTVSAPPLAGASDHVNRDGNKYDASGHLI